ncbi:MAG: phosphatase PAP2 family protein [Dehalococcoidia bacterium]
MLDAEAVLLLLVGVLLSGIAWALLRPGVGGFVSLLLALTALGSQVLETWPSTPAALLVVALLLRIRPEQRIAARATVVRRVLSVVAGIVVYEVLRFTTEGGAAHSARNAEALLGFERAIGLDLESPIQGWLVDHDALLHVVNVIYSHGYLPVLLGALIWLGLIDGPRFGRFASALGLSALAGCLTFALVPMAPPRLLAEAGLIDTIAPNSVEHRFVNEFAAFPSFHVGWFALAFLVLAAPWGRGAQIGAAAAGALIMSFVVVASGNHFVFDGVAGTVYALAAYAGVAAVCSESGAELRRGLTRVVAGLPKRSVAGPAALLPLLAYLLARQAVDPGFTAFWGYLVFQLAATILLLFAGDVHFRGSGGLSPATQILAVVCSYADTLGTDGDLYRRIAEYDKVTHFLGVAAVTSGVYDCFMGLAARGWARISSRGATLAAVAIGFGTGVTWEVYEWLGDLLLASKRVQSSQDTTLDIIFDAIGALAIAAMLTFRVVIPAREATRGAPAPEPRP